MIGLAILRLVLPPFHPLKYAYINWWFGSQSHSGGWKNSETEEQFWKSAKENTQLLKRKK